MNRTALFFIYKKLLPENYFFIRNNNYTKMKKTLVPVLVFTVLTFAVACTQAPDAPKATTAEPQQTPANAGATGQGNLKVDAQQSMVTWIGTKPTGRHNGSIKLTEGAVNVANGQLAGGSFVMNMNTVAVLDENMDESDRSDLTNHLKSEDFFDAAKFPDARFEITAVQPATPDTAAKTESNAPAATHNITGNLTLKGVTKSVTFPATIALTDAGLNAKANFNIDRTNWGITYKSDKSLGNKIIYPEVNIGINLVAKP
ncbi:YceI family protein [Sphingobacteriales bacterium UPWRP_1]|nr:hypothetical protein BVG80_09460 [Sphingobacteriales bacterium TSM_CSM]PSJ78577.1 YceI family protein [Sphingobacteriales bacterium UPWRP_1]